MGLRPSFPGFPPALFSLFYFLITLAWIILKGVFTPLGILSLFFLWRARY